MSVGALRKVKIELEGRFEGDFKQFGLFEGLKFWRIVSAKISNPGREIKHIFDLGAKVEYERFHANIQPTATKVKNMLYLSSWVRLPLPEANQNLFCGNYIFHIV